ncbi:DUF4153 domain-containing protein [Pseudoalteromonas sp. S16_S37]|uniref:DUF4153 domain-containing protein n=1 Tax=Pseudoalteromonas sp. S16_S37 TaxID=2720228 RepID=UPI00168012BF|nr:DUF4153 domain-containing protein [Pseudoalteromonas sp. S16_S37]MBD1584660.1 DUF4153 domain-containing protein [Pseudoalteromonas sp. S16_S37]
MSENSHQDVQQNSQTQRSWLLLCALLQALGLLLLHQALSFDWQISKSPSLILTGYAILLTGPTLLIYGVTLTTKRHFYNIVIAFTIIAALLGAYTGTHMLYPEYPDLLSHGFNFAAVMSLLTFKTFIFASSTEQKNGQWEVSYSQLIGNTCRLIITLLLAGIFTLIVWLIVVLWAELFSTIDIDVFKDIFYEPWFVYPTLSLAHTIGVLKVRSSNKIVNTANHLIQTLSFALLPLLLLLSSVFLIAIAFQGLDALWDNGGSNLVFVLTLLILLALNLAFQDSQTSPKIAHFANMALLAGIAILPIYLAISGYGLWLRVEQYGFSVSRLWAVFTWTFLTFYLVCYSLCIFKDKLNWLRSLGTINTRLGLLLTVGLLLTQSPILNFKYLSAQNQLARIHAGLTAVEDIDVYYFAHELGVAGTEALIEIEAHYAQQYPQLGLRIKAALDNTEYEGLDNKQFDIASALKIIGTQTETTLPKELLQKLQEYLSDYKAIAANSTELLILPVELNDDSQLEYVFISKQNNYSDLSLFYLEQGQWRRRALHFNHSDELSDQELVDMLINGTFEIAPSKFKSIKVNGVRLQAFDY